MALSMHTGRGDYLYHEVMTASPPKLHLMLVDAAIRHAARAQAAHAAGRSAEGVDMLIKAQEIVGELMAGLNADASPDLVRRMRSVYVYVFRTLVAVQLNHDAAKLAQVISLLEFERETWRLACAAAHDPAAVAPHAAAASAAVPRPAMLDRQPAVPSSGFSIEA